LSASGEHDSKSTYQRDETEGTANHQWLFEQRGSLSIRRQERKHHSYQRKSERENGHETDAASVVMSALVGVTGQLGRGLREGIHTGDQDSVESGDQADEICHCLVHPGRRQVIGHAERRTFAQPRNRGEKNAGENEPCDNVAQSM
jgi:hypothetical protein